MLSNNHISTIEVIALAALFVGLIVALGFMLVHEMGREVRLTKRLDLVTGAADTAPVETVKPEGALLLRLVSRFGMLIARSGLLSRKTLAEMTATLEGIGFRGGRGLGLFIGSKILLFFITPALLYVLLNGFGAGLFWMSVKLGGGALFGMLLPEIIATNIRTRHLEQVAAGVPDALDMLVICADAGLALEAGIARVAQEIQLLNPALAAELIQTSRELTIGAEMRQAMESLGQRTGLDTLKRLATTLTQSLQFGTPLTQSLRSLSSELRDEALIKFEERAGRLPTMMTIPMIVFILPCVFLIVAGPAIINVMATLHRH